MLLLGNLEPYHWAVGGLGVALVTIAMLWVGNQRLGVSSGFENVCALVVRAPYFRRREVIDNVPVRLPLLGGLMVGGFLSAVLGPGWSPTWNLAPLDAAVGLGVGGKVAWMFAGGLLIGFGTRLAGGCTSGHGIFGLSHLERASLESTLAFMAAGVVTSNLLFRVVFPL